MRIFRDGERNFLSYAQHGLHVRYTNNVHKEKRHNNKMLSWRDSEINRPIIGVQS